MDQETKPWQRRTPEERLIRVEKRDMAGMSFMDRVDRYRPQAERVLHSEKLSNLARSFLIGAGSVDGITEVKCKQFVDEHLEIMTHVYDTVEKENLPAAFAALVYGIAKEKEQAEK